MFSRLLSLAVLCCLSAPSIAETITYDFAAGDALPDWIQIGSGLVQSPGRVITNYEGGELYDGSITLGFMLGRPFTLDSIEFRAFGEYLYPELSGECALQPTIEDLSTLATPFETIHRDYGCTTYNGNLRFSMYSSFETNEDYYFAMLTKLTVTLSDPVPLVEGDTDYDADADLVDLNNTRNAFGGDPVLAFGDADKDGEIGLADLNLVRNNFGNSAGSSAVPEPSTWLLCLLLVAATGLSRTWRTGGPRSPNAAH